MLFLIDDLTDADGPIDDDTDADNDNATGPNQQGQDNFGGQGDLLDEQFRRQGQEYCTETGKAEHEVSGGRWKVMLGLDVVGADDRGQPGDNFRVAVGGGGAVRRALELDAVRAYEPGRDVLWFDWDGDGVRDVLAGGAEPFLSEVDTTYNTRATDRLVVWRVLRVEVDSMGAVAGNGLPAGHPERDVATENVPQPDLEALEQAMAEVFVEVRDAAGDYVMPDGSTITVINDDRTPTIYCFPPPPPGEPEMYHFVQYAIHVNESWEVERRLGRPVYLWLARAVGAYEPGPVVGGGGTETGADPCPTDGDLDPDGEMGAVLGLTPGDPDSPGNNLEPESSFVFFEVVRDQAADHLGGGDQNVANLYAAVVAHEIGHQFELADEPGDPSPNLMDSNPAAHMQRQGWIWSDTDKVEVRRIDSP